MKRVDGGRRQDQGVDEMCVGRRRVTWRRGEKIKAWVKCGLEDEG